MTSQMTSLFLVALATAFGVSAQSISQQCSQTLTQIAFNSTSACLSPSSLIPLLSSSNASLVDGLDTWISSACSTGPCSNDSLAAIVTNVTSGCGTELNALGFSSDDTPLLISTVQKFYPTVRQVVCLKDGSTNCVTEILSDIQTALGTTLTVSSVPGLISTGNVSLPNSALCSNCVKAAYSTVNSAAPGLLSSSDQSALQQQCGSSFTDGTVPSGIVESASNSSTSNNNNGALDAMSGNAFGIGASVLLVVGSALAML
ncbi:hypothetical protein D9757_000694 [Collybiopsis confluens]|uniref:Uncharacterized protein n=1 Tax=Collybiopsis confluens TaxID=2823264 RepID=A0A8H5I1H2_9AGAR|nr:hypothetical protein D9757_000694 [Collybiopsis confluens]